MLALRGPLSQFFSGLFLKKLDDAFDHMDVHYLRFQDDVLILCQSKRQLLRCRRRMMEVLHERGLSLSRKKSRIGCVSQGFHFLGVYYPPTQTADNTEVTHANDNSILPTSNDYNLVSGGGKTTLNDQMHEPTRIVPHPRTIRKAREQVKAMVNDGISTQKISRYLHRFVLWWVKASQIWTYEELIDAFIQSCFEPLIAKPAYSLLPGMKQARSLDLIDCPIAA